MINNFLYNAIIEIFIFIFMIIWFICGITLIIPIIAIGTGIDYFAFNEIINDIRLNKIKYNKN